VKAEKAPIQKDYSFLQKMSTEDLEQLLLEDYDLSKDESDMDLISKALEVLEKREKGSNGKTDNEDIDAELNQLHEKIGIYERIFAGIDDTHASDSSQTRTIMSKRLWYRLAGIAAAAILVVAMGVSTASAMGYDLWGGIARWTTEAFSFGKKESSFTPDEKYHELENTLVENDIVFPVLPKWLPNEYSVDEIMVFSNPDLLRITAVSYADENRLFFQVFKYLSDAQPERVFEADGDTIEKYSTNGIMHYILKNENTIQIVWARENCQVQIVFSDSSIDVTRIIESIYKE
jgi:hypothetical protein